MATCHSQPGTLRWTDGTDDQREACKALLNGTKHPFLDAYPRIYEWMADAQFLAGLNHEACAAARRILRRNFHWAELHIPFASRGSLLGNVRNIYGSLIDWNLDLLYLDCSVLDSCLGRLKRAAYSCKIQALAVKVDFTTDHEVHSDKICSLIEAFTSMRDLYVILDAVTPEPWRSDLDTYEWSEWAQMELFHQRLETDSFGFATESYSGLMGAYYLLKIKGSHDRWARAKADSCGELVSFILDAKGGRASAPRLK